MVATIRLVHLVVFQQVVHLEPVELEVVVVAVQIMVEWAVLA